LKIESNKIFHTLILAMISKNIISKDTKPKDYFEDKGWPSGE